MSHPSADDIALEIASRMRGKGRQALTIKWSRFYELAGRERVTAPLLSNIEEALKRESILMTRGVTVVGFMIDYDFAPLDAVKTPA